MSLSYIKPFQWPCCWKIQYEWINLSCTDTSSYPTLLWHVSNSVKHFKANKPHQLVFVLTPIYYHHNMRNLENTKISLFIRLKISRNKKNIKENKYEVILCITNFEKGTDFVFKSKESARDTQTQNMQSVTFTTMSVHTVVKSLPVEMKTDRDTERNVWWVIYSEHLKRRGHGKPSPPCGCH